MPWMKNVKATRYKHGFHCLRTLTKPEMVPLFLTGKQRDSTAPSVGPRYRPSRRAVANETTETEPLFRAHGTSEIDGLTG